MMKGFKTELISDILPFWMEKMPDNENLGFYGRIDGNNVLHKYANKGAILNMRILWTFSAAYRILGNPLYLVIAKRAFDYINSYFIDKEYGGIYWELDYKGNPVNTKKQTYVQGFALYGFSEFYRATGDSEALQLAKNLFYLIEEKCKDTKNGGYLEAFARDWKPLEDMRLSTKDANEKKSMNTHLHILEPYTNLCRIWENSSLKEAQQKLITIFTERILDKETYHLSLFFDEKWNVKSDVISYGHDIEASWLLYEAAFVLKDSYQIDCIKDISVRMVEAVSEGLLSDGSLAYEKESLGIDGERHWWVQAEAIVGYMYAWKHSRNNLYKEKAQCIWNYIQHQMIDKKYGEWYWSRTSDGTINRNEDKAGFWKCPYHNGRMCMEMIEHFDLDK